MLNHSALGPSSSRPVVRQTQTLAVLVLAMGGLSPVVPPAHGATCLGQPGGPRWRVGIVPQLPKLVKADHRRDDAPLTRLGLEQFVVQGSA